ncbi:MAG: copper chaperone [Cirrosporium novae-zelandiae]|nr:MAG: copper chaperone [Cirrosporium novae-zelandiae]
MTITPFQTTFAVPLHCDGCVKDVTGALDKLNGITKIEANIKDQMISVEGTAAPSAIVAAIQSTGRDAILRGSGSGEHAAVCILETHSTTVSNKIRGLVRMVQVSPALTVFDWSIKGLSPGTYHASVRECGDISQGAVSTGGMWEALKSKISGEAARPRGYFGPITINERGVGATFAEKPIQVWELIGRSMVVSKMEDGPFKTEDPDTLVGVIARSAGVWDNDKQVCSCSGKNVWQEREEQVGRGML